MQNRLLQRQGEGKGGFICETLEYQEFEEANPSKVDNEYPEDIPE